MIIPSKESTYPHAERLYFIPTSPRIVLSSTRIAIGRKNASRHALCRLFDRSRIPQYHAWSACWHLHRPCLALLHPRLRHTHTFTQRGTNDIHIARVANCPIIMMSVLWRNGITRAIKRKWDARRGYSGSLWKTNTVKIRFIIINSITYWEHLSSQKRLYFVKQ